uniref:Cytochrome c oxidase subunit 3 n=1 Tax=Nectonemertes cf. mirabilis HC-2011 TaxID=992350 RepID=I1SR48_9BILA|nr:cytochrome c oxidase subunit III [Nectonemertes cf. mirabilis HC-2011]ADZ05368.1 cytochrome c oxidase subunit III [Nectonemertes cf. mirabilis HC-2011]
MFRNTFHLVEYSPWPLIGSVGAFLLAVGLVSWMHGLGLYCMFLGLLVIFFIMFQWWRDVIREGMFQGYHTYNVSLGLRYGMILFIVSEVLFFFSFFWTYFHSSLAPTLDVGSCWPVVGLKFLSPFSVPLLNTAVLLASGVSVTWSHHSLMLGSRVSSLHGLIISIFLGIYFTFLQVGEYYEVSFSLSDGIFGSIFFVATGFHGLHVLIGTVFLTVCCFRIWFFHFSYGHHFGFEAAAWYWHFVDVVWLFLYLCIYWWGS